MASRNEVCLSGNVLDSGEIIYLGWGPWAIEIISGIRFVWQPWFPRADSPCSLPACYTEPRRF